MTIVYSIATMAGLFGIVFGFWGQSTLKSPYDTYAALLLPFSLVLGLGGALLLCVPHFFTGFFNLFQ